MIRQPSPTSRVRTPEPQSPWGAVRNETAMALSVLTLLCIPLHTLSLEACAEPPADTAQVPDEFPQFRVPGHDAEMDRLRELFWLHYQPAGPLIALWDEWMPMSTLWPAGNDVGGRNTMRQRWSEALRQRIVNAEGYVHTQQHDGTGHAEGWPFPLWVQAGGMGWHFASTGVPGYDAPLTTPDQWRLSNAQTVTSSHGWGLELTEPRAILETPPFSIEARIAPWLRLNWWARGLEGADCYVEWTTTEHPTFDSSRRAYFSPAAGLRRARGSEGDTAAWEPDGVDVRTMIRVHHLPGWQGTVTGLRIGLANRGPASVVIKSFHTASDTRHNINNPNFVRGCHDYFMWTRDLEFLRDQIGRIRTAMQFTLREFDTRRRKCVYTTWPGHEGRSGVRYINGQKAILPGEGVGSNYWDLLPFGGEDALASIYLYDALGDLANLEEQIAANPQWNIAAGADAFDPTDLRQHAEEIRQYGRERFWNAQTGRFGTVDLDGNLYDYGFTFLNNEAVYYDFASPEQARAIHAWISGQRTVAEDTSVGDDIYHWRFGPRSTTRRNLDYYFWAWSSPESIPWGYQVQDGGAVLGFSYHDLMARLKTAGPDDAWRRLRTILAWFAEVQAAGGYRAYYSDPARGTMQGGNVPGGLGLDREFFESILVPQVMLYGFLGLTPTADGCHIEPRLPSSWDELTITRIHLHDHVLDIRVTSDAIEVTDHSPDAGPLVVHVPEGRRLTVTSSPR